MVDLERTEKEYEKQGIPFPEDKASELGRVKKWKHQVTSEQGNFNTNPDDKTEQYPKRIPTQIIRKKLLKENGREVMTTIETYYGRDGIGNEVSLPVSEPQAYDTPIVRKHREYQDGRDVIKSEADGYKREHTTDWSEEAFKEAYSRANRFSVSLLVQEDGLGRKEVKIKDPERFIHGDFYDLLENKPTNTFTKTVTAENSILDTPTKKKVSKVSTIEGEVGVIAE